MNGKYDLSLKARLRNGEVLYGPYLQIPSATLVEIWGVSGFDFVVIDLEHGSLNLETAADMVRAAQAVHLFPILRVGENSQTSILHVLETGAIGVVVPQVADGEEARCMIQSSRFHPLGQRGMNMSCRAARYGVIPRSEYMKQSNEEVVVCAMVEGTEGISNLDDILSTDGLDVLLVGPSDLSQSLGFPGQVSHPEVQKQIERILTKTRSRGLVTGLYVDDVESARRYRDMGVQLIAVSVDVEIIRQAASRITSALAA